MAVLIALVALPASAQPDPHETLRARLAAHGVTPLPALPPPDPALYRLGEALFYDPILSGNLDTACATCHHPLLGTTDGLSLGLGTGNQGLGPARVHIPGRPFVARNAPALFNRGQADWRVMFWDGRVIARTDGTYLTPAGDALPEGLGGLLAAQALFPLTAAAEMRGFPGDVAVDGSENTLALLNTPALEPDYPAIWHALLDRLLAIDGYREHFRAAYPGAPLETLGIQHVVNALEAYQASAFAYHNAPFDRYLAGDDAALSPSALRGALLFFGEAGCARCHTGPLLSDQQFHNVAVPQIGPGMDDEAPLDYGRGRETGRAADRFAFRTPPLRQVALTGPYMHNGAYTTLEGAVRHMIAPVAALHDYDPAQLIPELTAQVWNDPPTVAALLDTLDPLAGASRPLTPDEFADLLAFLHALTDPAAADLGHLIPATVPSGLPVDSPPDS
ncbi:MAG: His-Xaa-Ser system-associated MauG-like protein [Anaerolineae bacterium]